jgi:hypothetical protein
MNFYRQGATAALQLLKVSHLLDASSERKMISWALQSYIDPEGKPRIVRTLEPYKAEYLDHDPEAFDRFDDRFRAYYD